MWTGPNLNFTDKRAYKIRAELNVFKHFRDFKHFLPRERTLQATDHHHFSRFLEKIAPIDRLHSTVLKFAHAPRYSSPLFCSRPNFRATRRQEKRKAHVVHGTPKIGFFVPIGGTSAIMDF